MYVCKRYNDTAVLPMTLFGFSAQFSSAIPRSGFGVILLCLLLATGTASAEPTWYKSTTGDVNVRSGPGTEYPVVGKLIDGESVLVVGVSDDGWAEIQYGKENAYVSTKYIVYDEPFPRQSPPSRSHWFKSFLSGLWGIARILLIILIVLAVLAFKDEIIQIVVYVTMFAGAGALVTHLLFHNGSIGAIIGFVAAVLIGLRTVLDLDDLGEVGTFLLGALYWLVSLPFYLLNQLQYILSEPWRYHFKRHRYYDSTNATLRPVLEVLKVLLYILITPLRVINAIYFDIIVHGLTELYDYLLEVFAPCNRKEGAGDVWIWLLTFPWRILKYPVFHGALALLESVIWTVIDTFIPAITLYHGTDLTAGQSITGEKRRNRRLGWGSGTFMASSSSWGGIGVYFAASRRVAFRYAVDVHRLSDNNPVTIVCRVSPGRIINYSLAPLHVYLSAGQKGHPSVLNKYGEEHRYTTGEWWNQWARYWEYCLFDWQNMYNNRWRIRPIYVYNHRTRLVQHIKGGMAHWIFKI